MKGRQGVGEEVGLAAWGLGERWVPKGTRRGAGQGGLRTVPGRRPAGHEASDPGSLRPLFREFLTFWTQSPAGAGALCRAGG